MKGTVFRYIVGAFCLVWLAKNALAPVSAYIYFHSDYMRLASACADAMDEGWFAEQENSPELNKTTKVHLLSCHEYDKTRKIMLIMGLNENVLSYLGLKALEIN
ncbi:TIGR03982 family His-Xaa-Ser system protein [Hahella sp. CR1]|uniref:TIGR03982 family His-Xaa-Ser system protein n=1 Tax=Hahella sp. CR1 TaxID=2992807 RepID=UPI0024415989|nr:TIGR03982 family His-Xaa-Ser system protein [Hahella sp. CR1]MDG9670543.1 TIGR03982 family His-Xaa-Ser system protein [Hahella sp. CR1]